MNKQEYAKYIDHTILKQDAMEQDVLKIITEAKENEFASVCVNPSWAKLAKNNLEKTNVKVCTVIGFPLGQNTTKTKTKEIKSIYKLVDEFDAVNNVSLIKDKKWECYRKEIKALRSATKHKVLKIILETCLLNDEEIAMASSICSEEKVDFVKTSTGFSTSGANKHVVQIMLNNITGNVKVKASGGVSSLEDMEEYLKMGVKRIGTSKGIQIINNIKDTKGY